MANHRPRARQKYVTGGSKGVKRRGSGLGTGPVGGGSRPSGSAGSSGSYGGGGSYRGTRSSGGKSKLLYIIIVAAVLLLGGGGGLGALLGGSGSGSSTGGSSVLGDLVGEVGSSVVGDLLGGGSSGGSSLGDLSSLGNLGTLLGGLNSGTTSTGWVLGSNTSKLNTSVAKSAREKRTEILGKGKDEVTIMVYMCGTDLESRSGMGTSDLQEMLAADLGENVNLLVYTGGCSKWQNNVVSSTKNQIYQIKNGKMKLLEEYKAVSMTDPDTLTGFIKWCAKNYPANRNQLIFWDHGSGSINGYGYDEKFKSTGSMDLSEINQALKKSGVKFDFVGFDACLMATLETALMLTSYSDYMIASEETEPGVGWYYTDWLTALGEDTSMPTVEIGKNIVDDFVETCGAKCRGQKTTLSVVDLAEVEKTVPADFKAFAKSASELIRNDAYKTVSDARYNTREFAQASAIDQVDLVHLAQNMGTEEGEELVKSLLSAVKYNRTSSDMTNAYGLSIYFPYKKVSAVDNVVDTYEAIGMDAEYARCIKEFASLEVGGQTAAGGTSSPLPSLLGSLLGGGSNNSGGSADIIGSLLGSFLSNRGNIEGLDRENVDFFSESNLNTEEMATYLSENYFDEFKLVWGSNSDGQRILHLPEEQWSLVHSLEMNMFYDDGEGYVDLGFDNVFEFDKNGSLLGETDRTWLAINGQPVAYYYLDTMDDGENYSITGRVPALLNGERVDLLLVFDNANPYGYIAGARTVYTEGETETVAKGMGALEVGDTLDFLCDYYSYDGEYTDSYFLGEQMTVTEDMVISNVDVGEGKVKVTFRFTDIYNQQYWTEAFEE